MNLTFYVSGIYVDLLKCFEVCNCKWLQNLKKLLPVIKRYGSIDSRPTSKDSAKLSKKNN